MSIVFPRIELLKKYKEHLPKIVKKCEEVLGSCEIYVFGSILDEFTGGSDVDLLIVSDKVPKSLKERAKILAKIEEELPLYHPFEFHLVDKKGFEFYRKQSKKMERIR